MARVQSKLTIHPEANISGTVYVEGRLLSGLIGKAGASLTANFDVHMPVTYDTAKSEPAHRGNLLRSTARISRRGTSGAAFPTPAARIARPTPSISSTAARSWPAPGGCPAATSAQAAESITAADPPQFDLQLAASGQGAVMAIWQQTPTSLATSLFDGVAWTPAGSIATGLGSSQPQVAFLAPNRALAVWTETNLTEAQLPGLSGEDLLRAQRIAYAVWDGAVLVRRAAPDHPQPGRGRPGVGRLPRLADRLSGRRRSRGRLGAQPVGKPGGARTSASTTLAIRTAAGVRRSRWTNAGAFTDILPQVAFVNGAPLVAWVRDSDADLDRRQLPPHRPALPGRRRGLHAR